MLRRDVCNKSGEVIADYSVIRGVDPAISVDEFKALWAKSKRIDIDSALIALSLVKCGRGKPGPTEEKDAKLLSDPSATLQEAGMAVESWLLADFKVAPGVRTPRCRTPCRIHHTRRRLTTPARNVSNSRLVACACAWQTGSFSDAPFSGSVLLIEYDVIDERAEVRPEQDARKRAPGIRLCCDTK